ncbi:hypothetical protein KJY77_02480 [Canibacter sp. lx-72]|uniref:hypothetical protein n=1 Tax=Canibacter zhuwentaonis TaxID=2837491 RepID=UPI001BDD0DB0|nr:hypothetical protein [Canibacter zhuwentaonis]MBT1018008.1 hypothetical protein [Canibacter zhuwentaonis]
MISVFLNSAKIARACLPEASTRLTIAVKFVILPCLLTLFFLALSSGGSASPSLESAFAVALGVSSIVAATSIVSLVATDRFEGVTVFLLTAHGNLALSWLGRYTVVTGIGSATALLGFAVSMAVTRVNFNWQSLPLIALLIVIAPLSAAGFGACLGSLSMWLKNSLTVSNVAEFALPIMIGMIAPVSVFPAPLQALCLALPPTHIVAAGRHLALVAMPEFWNEAALAIALGSGWFLAALVLWKFFIRRTRVTGNFEVF